MRRFILLLPVLLLSCADAPAPAPAQQEPERLPPVSSAPAEPAVVPAQAQEPASQPSPAAPSGEFDPLANADADLPDAVRLDVPFTSQAPHANWDPPFDEACEEASFLMVEYMLRGSALSQDTATSEIITFAEWEEQNGYAIDITIDQLAEIAERRFNRKAAAYHGGDVTVENIQRLLAAGYPVIIPAAGRELGNPYFSGDGPPYHMLVITGYEDGVFGGITFITNDPGTKRGEDYTYSAAVIDAAIHDWNGSVDTIQSGPRSMLVIGK